LLVALLAVLLVGAGAAASGCHSIECRPLLVIEGTVPASFGPSVGARVVALRDGEVIGTAEVVEGKFQLFAVIRFSALGWFNREVTCVDPARIDVVAESGTSTARVSIPWEEIGLPGGRYAPALKEVRLSPTSERSTVTTNDEYARWRTVAAARLAEYNRRQVSFALPPLALTPETLDIFRDVEADEIVLVRPGGYFQTRGFMTRVCLLHVSVAELWIDGERQGDDRPPREILVFAWSHELRTASMRKRVDLANEKEVSVR